MNQARTSDQELWRGAVIPSTVVASLGVVGGVALRQRAGFFAGVLAAAIVVIFLSVHLLVAKLSRNLDPIATMALALFSYFTKIVAMGALLILVTKLTAPETIDRPTFAVAALAITFAWLGGEIRAFLRLRPQLPLPPQSRPE